MSVPYLPLVHWNRLWEFKNSSVLCRSCGNIQPACKVRSPFMHQLDCKARTSYHQYPLRDLKLIQQERSRFGFTVDQLERAH